MDGLRTETGLEFVIAAIMIFLALIAAIGAVVRRGGLNKQDAEELLNDASSLQTAELETMKHTIQQLEERLSQAAAFQDEKLGRGMEELQENISASLAQIQAGVERTSIELKSSILELAKQQNEAKAQSAIQMCDALISSLGSVRNSIAAQIAEPRSAEVIGESKAGESEPTVGSETDSSSDIPPPLPAESPKEEPAEEGDSAGHA